MRDTIEVEAEAARLFVQLLGPRPPRFVYLHHQSGTSDIAPEAVRNLAACYGAAMPDVRGRGRSACADPAQHTWSRYAEDAAALVDALGRDRVVLGGVSFGAGVALAPALRFPSLVSGLFLWASPYAGTELGWADEQRRSLDWTFALADEVHRCGGIDGIARRAEVDSTVDRERETKRWLRHDPMSFAAALRGIAYEQPFRSMADLEAVSVPTVVIPGANEMHPPQVGFAYADTIPGARLADDETAEVAIRELLEESP